MGAMTFEQLRESVLDQARSVASAFTGPHEDWATVLIAIGALGQASVNLLHVPKEAVRDAGIRALRGAKAIMYGLVQSAWIAPLTATDRAYEKHEGSLPFAPSSHPQRQEVVLVSVADAEHVELHQAPIRRSKTAPPSLGTFELVADSRTATELTFRFDLREGLGPQLQR